MPGDSSILKARQFHARAQENVQLAEAAETAAGRRHYRTLAEHYLTLAEAELQAAHGGTGTPPGRPD